MTLRWNNLTINGDEIRIKKTMLKTKHPINILIYYKPLLIIFNYIPEKFISKRIKETYNIIKEINNKYGVFYIDKNKKIDYDYLIQNVKVSVKNIDDNVVNYFNKTNKTKEQLLLTLTECDDVINSYLIKKTDIFNMSYSTNPFRKVELNNDEVNKKLYIQKMLLEDVNLNYLRSLRTIVEEKVNLKIEIYLKKIDDLYLNLYKEMIEIIKQILMDEEYNNNFIFPLLENKDFSNITNERMFERMNETQYNKLSGRRSYYNQLLKIMGKQVGIPNLTSHKSRHSYTSILIKNNKDINLYDLSVSLGHQHISTTQSYIQSFINTRIDNMGKDLSDSFGKLNK
jgi:hypothetical protein